MRVAACIVVIAAVALSSTAAAQSQQRRPNPLSPHETQTYTVDGATIKISYGRPSMRGRKVFGGLRPYKTLWMPGADEATRIDTSADLKFGQLLLPKGSYTIYTIPDESKWTLIISKEVGQFHTVYHEDQDFGRLEMSVDSLKEPLEQLTISAAPAPAGGGILAIEWETTRAFVPFTVVR
jgi:hypothetical protein